MYTKKPTAPFHASMTSRLCLGPNLFQFLLSYVQLFVRHGRNAGKSRPGASSIILAAGSNVAMMVTRWTISNIMVIQAARNERSADENGENGGDNDENDQEQDGDASVVDEES